MIIDDYLNYLDEYRNKYGENTIIMMQVGSFFELYAIDINSKYLYTIADICNIIVSRKNKTIQDKFSCSINQYSVVSKTANFRTDSTHKVEEKNTNNEKLNNNIQFFWEF
jgi:hypothetical protein